MAVTLDALWMKNNSKTWFSLIGIFLYLEIDVGAGYYKCTLFTCTEKSSDTPKVTSFNLKNIP